MINFETALNAYRNAVDATAMLSGDDLSKALDTKADVLFMLAITPATSIGEVLQKLDVLRSLLEAGFSDKRDLMLFDSIRRDLKSLRQK